MHNVIGIFLIMLIVVATIYGYNAFVAKPGASIASLGVKAA